MTRVPTRVPLGVLLLLAIGVVLFLRYPGDKRKHFYFGLTVAGCLALMEVALRALIKWKYGDSSTAANLSRAVTVLWWVGYLVIMIIFCWFV